LTESEVFSGHDYYRGLAAETWDVFQGEGKSPDQDYYQALVARQGGAALDAGCGTGRLLLAYLEAGLDVEGLDVSEEMLDLCRARAADRGFSPALHRQPMERLDLPRRYRTIYIPCGSFVCITNRDDAMEALRRFHAHLEAGGVLAVSNFTPWNDWGIPWASFPRDKRGELPSPYRLHIERTLPDGTRYTVLRRDESADPMEQVATERRIWRKWKDGACVREEEHAMAIRWYYRWELQMMLELAGFGEITVTADYTDAPATADCDVMVFVARK